MYLCIGRHVFPTKLIDHQEALEKSSPIPRHYHHVSVFFCWFHWSRVWLLVVLDRKCQQAGSSQPILLWNSSASLTHYNNQSKSQAARVSSLLSFKVLVCGSLLSRCGELLYCLLVFLSTRLLYSKDTTPTRQQLNTVTLRVRFASPACMVWVSWQFI